MLTNDVTKLTLRTMNKKEVLELFGGTSRIARSIGISSQSVSQWPDTLTPMLADRVIAACVRAGIDPAPLLEAEHDHSVESNAPKKDAA